MFIYKTTCLVNNKIYIGKTKYNDPDYLGSGISLNLSIKRYGRSFFIKEIIEETIPELVDVREKFWIKFYNSTDPNIGYNISSGGDGGFTRASYTDAQMEEYKAKISKGLLCSQKYKEAMKRRTGSKNPEHSRKLKELYATGKIVSWNKGVPTREETRKKISEKNKGQTRSVETKRKIAEKKYVPVQQYDLQGNLLGTFKSIQEAHEITGVPRDSISSVCRGVQLTGGGFVWKYIFE